MLKSLKYYFFKKRRKKFIDEMYNAVDPWSAVLVKDVISGFIITHTQGKYKSALDVGCGEGTLTRTLSDISESYTGIDISEEALARAREAHKDNPIVEFKNLDFDRAAEIPKKFDLLCFSFTLDYLGFQKYPEKFTENLFQLISHCAENHCDVFIFNPVYNDKNLEDLQKYFFIFKNFGFHPRRNEILELEGMKLACAWLVKR
ncbi:MAG: Nodulation protein (NodS) [Pseudobdellovibrio sp.]|jgi:SAM-dependent methyltransferase|nr:Nodulation protein (NodS) [Pseudobdellovibrio sp.]